MPETMTGNERGSVKPVKGLREHFEYLMDVVMAGATWPQLMERVLPYAEVLSPGKFKKQTKKETKLEAFQQRAMNWQSGRNGMPDYAKQAFERAFIAEGITVAWFNQPFSNPSIGLKRDATKAEPATSKHLSTLKENGEPVLPLYEMGDDTDLHEIIGLPALEEIEVPEWLAHKNHYAVRVNTNQFMPVACRGDVMVFRGKEAVRHDRIGLVTSKSKFKSFLASPRLVRTETEMFDLGGKSCSESDVHYDGLLIAILPGYVPGMIKAIVDYGGIETKEFENNF